MKVLASWLFTYAQFKDIKVITDIIQQIKNEDEMRAWEQDDREVWLTTNGYPNFHMVTVYKVDEGGQEVFYLHRPYHSWNTAMSGQTYSDVLLKATEKQKEELEILLK